MAQPDTLLHRIEHFELDDPTASFPFSARLAQEQRWSRAYAGRVIAEYRRFIYLTTIATHPVTPSVDVDEVWHLHLTYSRSYWDRLCGEVLGRPLHHDPTQGGPTESSKFHDLYNRTLALYEQTFGAPPPPDIWPPAAVRFAPRRQTVEIAPATHWVVRKPALLRRVTVTRLALAALVILFTAGCTVVGFQQGQLPKLGLIDIFFGGMFTLFIGGMIGIFVLIVKHAKTHPGRAGKDSGSGCGGGGSAGVDGGGDGCGGDGCGGGGCGGGCGSD